MGMKPGGRRSQRGRPKPPDIDYEREPWLDEEQLLEEDLSDLRTDWPKRASLPYKIAYIYKNKR